MKSNVTLPAGLKSALILCPLRPELAALREGIQSLGWRIEQRQIGPLLVYSMPELDWHLALGGHGKTQFAICAQFLLEHLKEVKTLVCAGCSGGLWPSMALYDVIVAEKTIEHDFRMKFIDRPLPEFKGDPQLLAKCRDLQNFDFKVHRGVIASGDEDILDPQRAREVRELTSADAVAWEGAGGARASQFSGRSFLEVRGITDTQEHPPAKDFIHHLRRAMNHVSQVLLALAKS